MSFVSRRFALFATVRGLRRASICLVFGPIMIAWTYGWLLRIAPGHHHSVYLIGVTGIFLPLGLVEGVQLVRSPLRMLYGRGLPAIGQYASKRILSLTFVVVLAALLCTILLNNLRVPIFANDPLEYFTVARVVFDNSRLYGVYPLIDTNISSGFYGPWTHPPGFVLLIAWGYVVQGTAEYAGIAKLTNVYGMGSLLFLAFAWSGGLVRYRGVFAALLLLLTPFLVAETFDSHVDVIRVALWTATLCLLPGWFSSLSFRESTALGLLVGLSMFIHSIGLMFWSLMAGLIVVVSAQTFVSRLGQALVAAAASLVVVAPDYLQNLLLFGRIVGDSAPLWEVQALGLHAFLNEQRGIATLAGKLYNGVFAVYTHPSFFGFSTLAMSVGVAIYLSLALIAKRLNLFAFFRMIFRPTLSNILLICWAGFLGIVLISLLLDMNLIIKNMRYLGTMIGIAPILAPRFFDVAARYWMRNGCPAATAAYGAAVAGAIGLGQTFRNWRSWLPNLALVCVAIAMAASAANRISEQGNIRLSYFPGAEPRAGRESMDEMLACADIPYYSLIAEMNQNVPSRHSILVLALRPADVAYYARFNFVSYLDPRLVSAFSAVSSHDAYRKLFDFGVSHVLAPPYEMGEIENTALGDLLNDDKLVQKEKAAGGFVLYRLAGKPALLPPEQPGADVVRLRPGDVWEIDLSTLDGFQTEIGARRPSRCELTNSSVAAVDGENTLRVEGRAVLITRRRLEVDPSRSYVMSLDIKVSGGRFAQTEAGFVTFDEKGLVQSDPPGAHRYGVAANMKIERSGEWKHLSGSFRGAGNDNHNQFRVGTKYVSPVLILNYQGDTLTEIRRLRIEMVAH